MPISNFINTKPESVSFGQCSLGFDIVIGNFRKQIKPYSLIKKPSPSSKLNSTSTTFDSINFLPFAFTTV